MALQDLLNTETDFASLAAMARRGWSWWLAELADMLPKAWSGRLSARPRLVAERRAPGDWRLWKDGAPISGMQAERAASGPVALALPPGAVFVRELQLPRMSAADLKLMVAMDLDRLSPLDPALVHYDLDVLEREAAGGGQSVLLGVAPRALLAGAVEDAVAVGLSPTALGVGREDDPSAVRFDFMPAVRAEAGGAGRRPWATYAWAGVAALLVVNLALLIWRDVSDTARFQAIVDAQAPAVNAELRLRARVDGEDLRRRALLYPAGERPGLVLVLGALTAATPQAAWVQRFEWNGRAVRLGGYKPPGVDMLAAVRSAGLFANVRSLANQPAPASGVVQPYDIAADVVATRGRP